MNLVKRRERIARVRRVEHAMAAAQAMQAETQLEALVGSETRLTQIRCSLSSEAGSFAAETLASRAELALRLDEARFGLTDAIVAARQAVALRQAERLEARIRQESAEKLGERAVAQAARDAERRAANAVWTRPRGHGQ